MIEHDRLAARLARVVADLEEQLLRLRVQHAQLFAIREELFDRARDGVILFDASGAVAASPAARALLGLDPLGSAHPSASQLTRSDGSALEPRERPWARAMAGESVDAVPLSARGRPVLASARRTRRGAIVVLRDACDDEADALEIERSIAELATLRRRSRALLAHRRGSSCS